MQWKSLEWRNWAEAWRDTGKGHWVSAGKSFSGRAQQRGSPQADGVDLGAFQRKQNLDEVLEREKLILGEEDLG